MAYGMSECSARYRVVSDSVAAGISPITLSSLIGPVTVCRAERPR